MKRESTPRDTDPARWRDMPDATPSAALLLRAARRPRPPAAEELSRLGGAVGDLPRRSLAASLRNARLLAAGAAAATLLALGGGVWAWRGRHDPPPPPPARLPAAPAAPARPAVIAAPSIEAPREQAAPEQAAPEVAPRPAHLRHALHRPAAAAAPDVDTLTREIALVDAARRDVAAAPAQALRTLDAHRRAFPDGQLGAEREFLAVEALRRLGRTDEARTRAAALASRYPSSSYATRAARPLKTAP